MTAKISFLCFFFFLFYTNIYEAMLPYRSYVQNLDTTIQLTHKIKQKNKKLKKLK